MTRRSIALYGTSQPEQEQVFLCAGPLPRSPLLELGTYAIARLEG